MNFFREIEKQIDGQLRKLFRDTPSAGESREFIEIHRAILEDIGAQVQLLPRARRVFPHQRIAVRISPPSADRRRVYEIVFETLPADIRRFLETDEVEYPSELHVEVEVLPEPVPELAERGYHLAFSALEAARRSKPSPTRVRLTVIHGEAAPPTCELDKGRIYLGRLSEIVDEHQRPIRRNDIAFTERDQQPNSTVSRAHAHLEADAETAVWRIFDDNSAYGTSIVHEGRLITVPAGGRGIRLHSGDELYLGQARVLFEIA